MNKRGFVLLLASLFVVSIVVMGLGIVSAAVEIVNAGPNVSSLSLEMWSPTSASPVIAYVEGNSKQVRYIERVGGVWANAVTIDTYLVIPEGVSLDRYSGQYYIAYTVPTFKRMYVALESNGRWGVVETDGAGLQTSVGAASNFRMYTAYYDITSKVIKSFSSNWLGIPIISTIQTPSWDSALPSLAIDKNDIRHVSFTDSASGGRLSYVKTVDSSVSAAWGSPETADSASGSGFGSYLALDSNNKPHISYYYQTGGKVRYAQKTGASWVVEDVDTISGIGQRTSMAVDSNNVPHIIYYSSASGGSLKYANKLGGSWNIQTIDTGVAAGKVFVSLKVDKDNKVHVAYSGIVDNRLKYQFISPVTPPPTPPAQPPAQTTNQIILKLSGTTNAHGELWNGTSYSLNINYSDVFGSVYTGTNPNRCSAGDANLVLRLSGTTNAHAEIPSNSAYLTKICYGDITSCTAVTGGASCPVGRYAVVKLSGTTNAHLADKTASSTAYPVTVCCSKTVAQDIILESKWIGSIGNTAAITQSTVGSMVTAYAKLSTGLTSGVSFEVYESGVASPINTTTAVLYNSVNKEAYINWKVPASGAGKTYYFKAKYLTEVKQSGNLLASQVAAVCGNGIIETGEECDGTNLNGETCQSKTGSSFGTLLCYAPEMVNQCHFDISGCLGTDDVMNAEWQNLYGERIDEVKQERTVQLSANVGSAVSSLSFRILEEDTFVDNEVAVISASDVVISNGKAVAYWEIPTGILGDSEEDIYSLYFEARAGSIIEESNRLNVGEVVDGEVPVDRNPDAVITKPVDGAVAFLNTPITFEEASTDDFTLPENLDRYWNIGNGEKTSSESTFTHTFTTKGSRTVSLRVTDSGNNENTESVTLNVIDPASANKTFVLIEKPRDQEVIVNESKVVRYSGEDSYVLRFDVASATTPCVGLTVVCAAGKCPSTTSIEGCSGSYPITGTNNVYSDLLYNWNFQDGTSRIGKGIANASGIKAYGVANEEKEIKLTLTYLNSEVSSSTNELTRNFFLFNAEDNTDGICSSDGTKLYFFKIVDGKRVVDYTLGTANLRTTHCVEDDCCPYGYRCLAQPDSEGRVGCVPVIGNIADECEDYDNEDDCGEDPDNVVNDGDYLDDEHCGELINGKIKDCDNECSWKNDQCVLGFDWVNPEDGSPLNELCYKQITGTESSVQEGCQDITTQEICGTTITIGSQKTETTCELGSVFDLPVFGFMQMLVCIAVLGIIYMFLARKRQD